MRRNITARSVLIVVLLFCQAITAFSETTLKDSLISRLNRHVSYQEQIRVLRNLIDLSTAPDEMFRYINRLYSLAKKNKDINAQVEMIRYYGNHNNPDTINYYLKAAERLPKSNAQKEATVFLHSRLIAWNVHYQSDKVKLRTIENLIKNKPTARSDIYDQLDFLLSMVTVMSTYCAGELYMRYLENMSAIVKRLPADGQSVLPNVCQALASDYYSEKGMEKEDLKAQSELMAFTKRLEQRYHREGRIYRNYDAIYFVIYSRMLKDYHVMSSAKIRNIFSSLQSIAMRNNNLKAQLNSSTSIVLARYYVATKQYKKAKSYIHAILKSHSPSYYMECLKYHIEVAQQLHNKDHIIEASLAYNKILEEKDRKELVDKAKELQIVYNVNGLTQRVFNLELAKKRQEIASNYRKMYFMWAVLFVVIVFFIITSFLLYRSKKLTLNLKTSQEHLQRKQKELEGTMEELVEARNGAEMANQMKTMFIQNMNHEIRTPLNAVVGFSQLLVDNDNGLSEKERQKYGQLIEENGFLLTTLVSDVLDIARMESGEISYNLADFSVNELCGKAVDSVLSKVSSGVRMYFDEPQQDFILHTDEQRVMQVLINYLTNACKHTEKGEIKLSYQIDAEKKEISFAVTDTGTGVPKDKASVVFQRFEKLDRFSQGTGLGLHICQLIADALNGKVKLDTSYDKGARFLFILPIK